jgi:hypothetical protein
MYGFLIWPMRIEQTLTCARFQSWSRLNIHFGGNNLCRISQAVFGRFDRLTATASASSAGVGSLDRS